ncbi:outer dense fiber protein 3-B [Melanotaenia boesemani]|uniref:outer dense fiber protein 3-B n=1 Tax=Melanotaenia boesemani TaxID=1250792 RepID=UPI001C05B3DE|nr:outer dense fiber protein 3-B [Melanotaenia boesemani]
MPKQSPKTKPNKEPWVGTWRPHKPRGPIAAFYSGPGPKYALPGLTGVTQHDPTKCKAPVFSFGARYVEVKTDCSPGPKYQIPSNITQWGRNSTPSFSLGSRTKQPEPFQAPGPGHYSPEKSEKLIFPSAPAFPLFERSQKEIINQIPGPATYTLPPMLGPNVVSPSAPSFSLCSRRNTGSFYEDLQKTPGPAAYKAVDPGVYRQNPPQYSISGRNFHSAKTSDKPGPGAHYPERVTLTKSKAPSFTFGLRHSQYISPLIPNMD